MKCLIEAMYPMLILSGSIFLAFLILKIATIIHVYQYGVPIW